MGDFWDDEQRDSASTETATKENDQGLIDQILEGTAAQERMAELKVSSQLARQYPRKLSKFFQDVKNALVDEKVAAACGFTLPRKNDKGEFIKGPSIGMAEICANAYGNLQIDTSIIGGDEPTARFIVARAKVFDGETNNFYSCEVRRRTTYKDKGGIKGGPYNDDMRVVTGNAASSIARRNAIFMAIGRPNVDKCYRTAMDIALGKKKGLEPRRDEVISGLVTYAGRKNFPLTEKQIIEFIGKPKADMVWDDVEILIGIGQSIKEGETTFDKAFSPEPKNGDNPDLPKPDNTPEAQFRARMNKAGKTPGQIREAVERNGGDLEAAERDLTAPAKEAKPEPTGEEPITEEMITKCVEHFREKAKGVMGDTELRGLVAIKSCNHEEIEAEIENARKEYAKS